MANKPAVLRIQDFWKAARDVAASQQQPGNAVRGGLARAAELLNCADPASLACRVEPLFPSLSLPAIGGVLETGLARGTIMEISGQRSSGRTGLAHHILAQATLRGEICAVVDLAGAFAPAAAQAAGVILPQVVWVRCGNNIEHALRAADLLIHAGGFGIVLLDICDASARMLNRIPLSYWFRFRRALENTPANLVVCAPQAVAKSCSSTNFALQRKSFAWSGKHPARLLRGIESTALLAKTGARPISAFLRTVA